MSQQPCCRTLGDFLFTQQTITGWQLLLTIALSVVVGICLMILRGYAGKR
ncbi:hypothetical protein FHT44_005031 [Mycolicibacterium sp. BK634]|nr:hypothetical protein [Mycolicibacterium sp. BK634]MBB3752519.1 hypothetical protein [Mycolicibacterium sp. BK634]